MDQKKYYTLEEAAQILGLTSADVHQRRERNELRGFRDGTSWKFKVEDVEAFARHLRAAKKPTAAADESSDVLLSEAALGGSDSTASGTVIGPPGKAPSDSDIRLADSALNLDEGGKPGAGGGKELTLDEEALVDESEISLDDDASGTVAGVAPAAAPAPADNSSVDLAEGPKKLDDDDIVLGGSGSGSDISIGSDSGISLLDPTDSGLSLEEPLEAGKADEDSLELGEDDMLTFADDSGSTEAPTALKKDEEFLLTPLEEAAEEESESGSQVIALDSPGAGDMTATMVAPAGPARPAAPGMAAMLDEDFAAAGGPALAAAMAPAGIAAPLGPAHPVFAEGMPLAGAGPMPAAIPQAPYTGLNVTSLAACLVLILLCGWLAFDLVRNMWSWNGSFPVNSGIMDAILGLFG